MIISRRVVEAIGNEWLNQLDDSYKDFRPIKSDLKKEETFLWIYVPISSGDFLEKNLSNSKDGLCLLPKLIRWLYETKELFIIRIKDEHCAPLLHNNQPSMMKLLVSKLMYTIDNKGSITYYLPF